MNNLHYRLTGHATNGQPVTLRVQANTRAAICALLAALLLTACGSTPTRQAEPADYATTEAREMAARGDHRAASREYLDMAAQASGTQKQRYLIFASGELYLANDLEGAERILNQAGADIAASNLEVWAEITAMLRLARNEPESALNALNQVKGTDNKETAISILALRAQALFQLQQPQQAVATLLKREELLTSQTAIEENHRLIWSGLQTSGAAIPPDAVQTAADNPLLAGWLELGYLAHQNRTSASSSPPRPLAMAAG